MSNKVHMMSNIDRRIECEFLIDILNEDGDTMSRVARLMELFDIMDRKTGFSWDDLPAVTSELYHEPDPQLMLPFVTSADMKKWEVLKKKYAKKGMEHD